MGDKSHQLHKNVVRVYTTLKGNRCTGFSAFDKEVQLISVSTDAETEQLSRPTSVAACYRLVAKAGKTPIECLLNI